MKVPYAGTTKEDTDPIWDVTKPKANVIADLTEIGWHTKVVRQDGAIFVLGTHPDYPNLKVWCEKVGLTFDPPLLETEPNQDFEDLKQIRWNELRHPQYYVKVMKAVKDDEKRIHYS